MPPPSSSLTRHLPAVLTGVSVAALIISFHLYVQKRQKDQRRLRRSNARRIRRRTSTPPSQPLARNSTGSAANAPLIENQNAPAAPPADDESEQQSGETISTRELEQQLEQGSALSDEQYYQGNQALNQNHPASEYSFNPETSKENQNLLNLLYLIAEDQAKRDGYVHRGVTCNSCRTQPIRGIRYRCANCADFDLCEHCESLESHPRTHLFYKVRIPAQFLGNPRPVQPPSYPGKPGNLPLGLGIKLVKEFERKSGFEQAEVEALYEQFKCLAASEYPEDPHRIYGAISRKTLDKCFYLKFSSNPPLPNLIYDRMFAIYDTNDDGLIGFEEFILGLAALHTKLRPDEKWKRIFKGYDFDGDGYVERKDFLRMFRAYYLLSKEHVQDIVASMEEEMIESGTSTNVLLGSQPISAAFPSLALSSSVRGGKAPQEFDQEMLGQVVLPTGTDETSKEEMDQFRAETWGKNSFSLMTELQSEDEALAQLADAVAAAGESFADNAEEGGEQETPNGVSSSAPSSISQQHQQDSEDYSGGFSSDIENIPPPPPLASSHSTRSQSSAIPAITTTDPSMSGDDYDFYTIAPEAGEDVGNEILYQVTQQGLNELLNMLFKGKEDGAVEVRKRRERREKEKEKEREKEEQQAQVIGIGTGMGMGQAQKGKKALLNSIMNNPTAAAATDQPGQTDANAPLATTTTSSTNAPLHQPTPPKPHARSHRTKAEADYDKYLDKVEAEIKERGGPGRINYEEFERLMRQDGWRRFAFAGSWVDMASF